MSGSRAQPGRRLLAGTIACLVFALCVVYIARTFQWAEIWPILIEADIALFVFGAGLSVVACWLARALRLFLLMRTLRSEVRFSDLYLLNSAFAALAIITPLQSGEAFKVEALKKIGVTERAPGYVAFAIERLLDLSVVAVWALLAGGLLFSGFVQIPTEAAWLALLLLGVSVPLIWRLRDHLTAVVEPLRTLLSNPIALLADIGLTAVSWLFVALSWRYCLMSIGLNIDVLQASVVTAIATLINVLSFIPGALGVSEAAIAELLIRLGYPDSQAQAGGLMIRGQSFLVLLLGAIHLAIWWPRRAVSAGA